MSNSRTRGRVGRIAAIGGVGLTVAAGGLVISVVRSLREVFTTALADPYLATEKP